MSLTINIIVTILYIVFIAKFYKDMKNEQVKKPLVITARVKRLIGNRNSIIFNTISFLIYSKR